MKKKKEYIYTEREKHILEVHHNEQRENRRGEHGNGEQNTNIKKI